MLRKNFPGRIEKRRRSALARLEAKTKKSDADKRDIERLKSKLTISV